MARLALFFPLRQPLRLLFCNSLLLKLQLLALHNGCALVLGNKHRFQHDAMVDLVLVFALLCPLPTIILILVAALLSAEVLRRRRTSAHVGSCMRVPTRSNSGARGGQGAAAREDAP